MKLWISMPREESLREAIVSQISAQRGQAAANYRLARWLERAGWHTAAHRLRHDVRLSLRMAIKMQRGLDTGVYRLGRRMFPSVEDQCGCAEYCHRPRS